MLGESKQEFQDASLHPKQNNQPTKKKNLWITIEGLLYIMYQGDHLYLKTAEVKINTLSSEWPVLLFQKLGAAPLGLPCWEVSLNVTREAVARRKYSGSYCGEMKEAPLQPQGDGP